MDDSDLPEDDDERALDELGFAGLDDEKLLALHELFFQPRKVPEELENLRIAIRDQASRRMVIPEETGGYFFEGYEAFNVRSGGMGMVIEALDPELDRKVAIKLWARVDPKATTALLAEAKTLAKLTHPNVVRVYGTGRWEGRVYFVMEWVEGMDGRVWLEQPRPWREVRDVFLRAGEGLAAAHEGGIQHRDFKPANMLVGDDGRVLVADFGIAASLGAETTPETDAPGDRRKRGSGTLGYMAPERLRGGAGDARSDLYSFCVALWEGLHGARPFFGLTAEQLLDAIENRMIIPGRADAGVPHWLSRVVRKGLEFEPDRRWAGMRELLRALQDEPPEQDQVDDEAEAAQVERPEGAVLHSPASPPEPDRGLRMFIYAGMTALLLGVGVLVGLALVGREQPPSTPQSTPAEASEPTRTPPERVLDRIGSACTLPPGAALVHGTEFWAECRKELDQSSQAWELEVNGRELKGQPTHQDTLRIAEGFLEKARALESSGGEHSCLLTEQGKLHCSFRRVLPAGSVALSPDWRKSVLKAVSSSDTWGRAARSNAELHQPSHNESDPSMPNPVDSIDAATNLLEKSRSVAARLTAAASQNK